MARTNTLGNFLTDVADAIREKKGTSETIQASEFDTEIANLPSGGDVSEYFDSTTTQSGGGTTDSVGVWMKAVKKLPAFPINNGVGSLYKYFNGEEIDLTEFIKFANNNVNNNYFSQSFGRCSNLKEVDLSTMTKSGTSTINMFAYCTSMRKIDMRNFDFTQLTDYNGMFGTSASTGVPDNCLIIVADQTQKDWINTNFSRLTNVQTVAEYEASLNS